MSETDKEDKGEDQKRNLVQACSIFLDTKVGGISVLGKIPPFAVQTTGGLGRWLVANKLESYSDALTAAEYTCLANLQGMSLFDVENKDNYLYTALKLGPGSELDRWQSALRRLG